MPTRLKLICHASTAATRSAAFPADEPLEPQGSTKLGRLAERFHDGADRCWTSPALRARQTADALGLDATVEPLLRDCDYGRWSGRSFDEVQAQEPDALAEWLGGPAEAAPHGGESISDVMARTAIWLDLQGMTGGRIVAVTHAPIIRAAIVQAIEATPRSFWRIDIMPLSVTKLSHNNGRWTLVSLGPVAWQAT